MPSFEGLFFAGTLLLLALGALGLFAVLRRSSATAASDALGQGRFTEALAQTADRPGAPRDELLTAALAAKHLLDFGRAAALLDRILAAEPSDGEARLERGLVNAYAALAARQHPPAQDPPRAASPPSPAPPAASGAAIDAPPGRPAGTGSFAAAAEEADAAFRQALASRSDLAESITLHRAWLALLQGDRVAARRLFDEVEASLETKLRSDLGTGEPLFAEWFLHSAALWAAFGEEEKAAWARHAAREAAPESHLPDLLAPLPAEGVT